jgi:hypothetical protein
MLICFVQLSQLFTGCLTKRHNRLVFVMDTDCVLCEIWTEFLDIIQMNENSAPIVADRFFSSFCRHCHGCTNRGRACEAWGSANKEMPPRPHGQLKCLSLLLDFLCRYLANNLLVAKRVCLRPIFRVGNSQKSLGAGSGEYGGWVMTGMLFSTRNSQPWRTSDRMRRPNSVRFQKKPFAGASNNGRIGGASVYAR